MSCARFVTFDFVEGSYIMKFTEQSQVVEAVGVSSKVKENAKVAKIDSKLMYRNEMNSITFPNLTAMEFNMFFTICYFVFKYIKKNGTRQIIKKYDDDLKKELDNLLRNNKNLNDLNDSDFNKFDSLDEVNFIKVKFDDLRIFLPQIKNKKRFYNEILKFAKYKLRYIGVDKSNYNNFENFQNNKEGLFRGASFFYDMFVDKDREILGVKITPFVCSMLSEFVNFMSFDMNEFCKFENKYTKSLFRLLKQYENSNYAKDINNPKLQTIFMSKTDFERFINAPSEYDVKDLERRAIIPSVNEIKLFKRGNKTYSFENVDYEKIYDESEQTEVDSKDIKRRNVKGFKFIFEKRKN